jgi:hypothetical protein
MSVLMIAVSLRLLSDNDTPRWELDKSSWMWSALFDQFVKSIKIVLKFPLNV